MSGIAGKYNLNGSPLYRAEMEGMLLSMPHRGPDGQAVWVAGAVGIGHCMLHTTPESLTETLPLVAGDRALTGDVRLDNRAALIRLLGLPPRKRAYADSELVLLAYERWGEQCVTHLIGDFAFAIWDGPAQKLFCARDHFGLRPFFYHHEPGRHFAFATEIKALLTLDAVPARLNEVCLGDYLGAVYNDAESTIYEGVRRLPAAHVLVVDRSGVRQRRYYELQPARDVGADWTDEQYADRFRALFEEGVRCRVRSAFPVGSELSGGLDSSYVTCVARNLLAQDERGPLHTFSIVFETVQSCDEQRYIDAVLESGGMDPHFVVGDTVEPLANLDEVYDCLDDGLVGGAQHWLWEIYQEARNRGVRVMLDGVDGDTTVSHGLRRFSELARAGDWKTFFEEAVATAKNYYFLADHTQIFEQDLSSDGKIFSCFAMPVLYQYLRRGRVLKYVREVERARRFFKFKRSSLWKAHVKVLLSERLRRGADRAEPDMPVRNLGLVRDDFADRIGLWERAKTYADPAHGLDEVRAEQQATLASPSFSIAMELKELQEAILGIEVRHPFLYLPLVEYCLALPVRQSLYAGWPRAILRRAMEGTVPEMIVRRMGKADIGPGVYTGFLGKDNRFMQDVLDRLGVLEPYVNMDRFRDDLAQLDKLTGDRQLHVHRYINLCIWMSKRLTQIRTKTASSAVVVS